MLPLCARQWTKQFQALLLLSLLLLFLLCISIGREKREEGRKKGEEGEIHCFTGQMPSFVSLVKLRQPTARSLGVHPYLPSWEAKSPAFESAPLLPRCIGRELYWKQDLNLHATGMRASPGWLTCCSTAPAPSILDGTWVSSLGIS